MRAIAGGYRTRARMARACTFVLVLVLLALLELALRRRGGEGRPRTTTVDWWPLAAPQKYFLCFPYQNDESPPFLYVLT